MKYTITVFIVRSRWNHDSSDAEKATICWAVVYGRSQTSGYAASSSSSSSPSYPKLLQRVAPLPIVLFTAPKFVNPSPIRLSCVKSAGRHLKVKSGTCVVVKITRYSEGFLVLRERRDPKLRNKNTICTISPFRIKNPVEKFNISWIFNTEMFNLKSII